MVIRLPRPELDRCTVRDRACQWAGSGEV